MAILRARVNLLALGFVVGFAVGQGSDLMSTAAPAAKEPPARLVVGLKGPLTPAVVAELKRTFRDRIVLMAPLGQDTLVLLRRGETLEEVQRQSKLIRYVEPEGLYQAAAEARKSVLLIPAPRWPKGKK